MKTHLMDTTSQQRGSKRTASRRFFLWRRAWRDVLTPCSRRCRRASAITWSSELVQRSSRPQKRRLVKSPYALAGARRRRLSKSTFARSCSSRYLLTTAAKFVHPHHSLADQLLSRQQLRRGVIPQRVQRPNCLRMQRISNQVHVRRHR